MARIRTVKPDLFRHEELFEAETEADLPLRLAYIGLFTVADREGRFKWRPRQLKLDVLPYDDIDFSRVLDALATRGFIQKYTVNGEIYGLITSFTTHQVINNRESESTIPDIGLSDHLGPENTDTTSRVPHASATRHNPAQVEKEGKGREEEGKGKGNSTREPRAKKSPKRFVPPTLEEVKDYQQEKDLNVDPLSFFDYFNEGNWYDSKGNKVKNWKQKMLTWSKHGVVTANRSSMQQEDLEEFGLGGVN